MSKGEREGSIPGKLPVPLRSRHSKNFSFGRPKEQPKRTMDTNREEDMDHRETTSNVEVDVNQRLEEEIARADGEENFFC